MPLSRYAIKAAGREDEGKELAQRLKKGTGFRSRPVPCVLREVYNLREFARNTFQRPV